MITIKKPPSRGSNRIKRSIPFAFVLDLLIDMDPVVRPMFGCHAIYVGTKICLIVRHKEKSARDNGVWLATTHDNHESLKMEFPSKRSISALGPGATGWQVLPMAARDFEVSVTRACQLIVDGDPRIGKIPKAKKSSSKKEQLFSISEKY